MEKETTVDCTQKPAGEASSSMEQILEQKLPPNAKWLMDYEVAEVLQRQKDQMALLPKDPNIRFSETFDKTFDYVSRDVKYCKAETLKKILEPLKKHGASDFEICQIANIWPESVDQAFDLFPGLKPKMTELREPLKAALDEMARRKMELTKFWDELGLLNLGPADGCETSGLREPLKTALDEEARREMELTKLWGSCGLLDLGPADGCETSGLREPLKTALDEMARREMELNKLWESCVSVTDQDLCQDGKDKENVTELGSGVEEGDKEGSQPNEGGSKPKRKTRTPAYLADYVIS